MRFFWQRRVDDEHEHRASSFGASSFGASSMALLMIAPTPEIATADQAKITVSATVLKHASLKVLASPASVVITAADISRGYVDVSQPARISVKNNSAGYLLSFAGNVEFARQIRVQGLGPDVLMGAEGGVVARRAAAAGMNTTTMDLGFRFELAAGVHEGVYPWPLELSVSPI